MKKRIIQAAGLLFLSVLMTTSLNAQRSNMGGRGTGDGPGRADRFAALELTEEQQAEILTLRTAHYKEITPMKNKMAELKARERTLMSEENVDLKAVGKSIDDQTDLTNSMRKLQAEHLVTVKSLLTDEQVMKLQQRRKFAQRNDMNRMGARKGRPMNSGQSQDYRGYRSMRGM